MENKNSENRIQENEDKIAKEEELVSRITVTNEALEALDKLLNEVNEGFDAGRVSKQDLAGWILVNFKSLVEENYVDKIRSEFFNELVRFKSLLKLAQLSGEITPDIKKALRELGENVAKPKKVKKPLKKDHIIDMNCRKEVA